MKYKVPFLDLTPFIKKNAISIRKKIFEPFVNCEFISSNQVKIFEDSFANFCGAKYCVGTSNGLDAIKLILAAHNISHGHEVLVPSNTFIATWLAVSDLGAKPVPVEPSSDFNISVDLIQKAITKKTKAIICVHLYGRPCNIEALKKIAQENKLYLFEDMAQAHGAKYFGKPVGSFGNGAAVSFYPGKNLGAAGDAGAILVNNKRIYNQLLKLRNYGSAVKYHHDVIGFNNRMDEVQAAYLNFKLPHLEKENAHRKKIAQIYISQLKNISELKLPCFDVNYDSVWHLFVIRVHNRDSLKRFLDKNGIQTIIHYPIPPFKQKAYLAFNDLTERFKIK